MPRKILHVDLDAFFCAVEERADPSLEGKAFIVGGRPNERSVVLSASYAARRLGVRSAMPVSRALTLCPRLRIVPPRHHAYHLASEQVMQRFATLTPLVEPLSIDEAFLDVSDLPEPGVEIARRLQAQIRAELSLPCSIGIAANKLVAKMATDAGKAANRSDRPPFAILEVLPGQEAAFMAPLPIQALWGVGPKTAEHMKRMGIRTIGDLTRLSESYLVECFGKNGYDLVTRARGLDDRPVETSHNAKSVSQETTYDQDVSDASVLRHTLLDLARHVGFRLRRSKIAGSTVRLKLRWSDFSTITRQVTLDQPSDQDQVIFDNVWQLFELAWPPGKPVRLIGVGVANLGPQHRQLSLWDQSNEKERRLLAALDDLRERYGEEVVFRGYEIGKDEG